MSDPKNNKDESSVSVEENKEASDPETFSPLDDDTVTIPQLLARFHQINPELESFVDTTHDRYMKGRMLIAEAKDNASRATRSFDSLIMSALGIAARDNASIRPYMSYCKYDDKTNKLIFVTRQSKDAADVVEFEIETLVTKRKSKKCRANHAIVKLVMLPGSTPFGRVSGEALAGLFNSDPFLFRSYKRMLSVRGAWIMQNNKRADELVSGDYVL